MDKRLALMCGIDIPIPECQLVIHQPTIEEIAYIGESDFFVGVQTFCVNKKLLAQGNSFLDNTNNFQIFMAIMSEKETVDKKLAVQEILTLFFPKYNAMITPRSIILNKDGQNVIIDEKTFDIVQNLISEICCLQSSPAAQQTFNPADAKAQEIAQKLMRGRQRVAEQKGETNVSIFSQYLSILTVGLNSISLQDAMNLTIYQVYDLIERFNLYISWDIDIRSRLAGGKPESKPDNWMKNIH